MKIDDACQMLKDVGFSNRISTKSMAARFILAATNTKENDDWKDATNNGIRIHDSLIFLNEFYNIDLKENTRESMRKSGPKKMITVGLAKNNASEVPTNSQKYTWFLTDDFFRVVKSYRTSNYQKELEHFKSTHQSRIDLLKQKRNKAMIPITYNGQQFHLSPGKHNKLHKEILEKFAPTFAGGAELLYVGDTDKKDLILRESDLQNLGFPMSMHYLIPDIVLYQKQKDWIFLIEAVSSTGPISIDRVKAIKKHYKGTSGLVFVTAFQDWDTYKKFIGDIAWETEIWIADFPDHMIHMNGSRFMGPYND